MYNKQSFAKRYKRVTISFYLNYTISTFRIHFNVKRSHLSYDFLLMELNKTCY